MTQGQASRNDGAVHAAPLKACMRAAPRLKKDAIAPIQMSYRVETVAGLRRVVVRAWLMTCTRRLSWARDAELPQAFEIADPARVVRLLQKEVEMCTSPVWRGIWASEFVRNNLNLIERFKANRQIQQLAREAIEHLRLIGVGFENPRKETAIRRDVVERFIEDHEPRDAPGGHVLFSDYFMLCIEKIENGCDWLEHLIADSLGSVREGPRKKKVSDEELQRIERSIGPGYSNRMQLIADRAGIGLSTVYTRLKPKEKAQSKEILASAAIKKKRR